MSNIFKIVIPSNTPEVSSCEVLLPGGPDAFGTGWMVTKFVPNIFEIKKVIASIAINIPNIQISATLDLIKEKPRIVVSLGKKDPIDEKVVEISSKDMGPNELTVYWNDWKIGDVEWSGKKLEVLQDA